MYQYFPKARSADLVVQETEGELLVYDLTTNEAFCLNETSALIWQTCDGTKSVSDISSAVSRKTRATVTDDLVVIGISELFERHLLESSDLQSQLTGISRRDMVKKAGIGAMIAVPLIASLIAPLPVHAASSCVAGGVCTCSQPTSDSRPSGTVCSTSVPCTDSNCQCVRTGPNGTSAGSCSP